MTPAVADVVLNQDYPPASLAQWYKPVNKRDVWLHNMFKLRREMHAIQDYAELGDKPLLQKWTLRFAEHYNKISEMVPEWKDELLPEEIDKLQAAVAAGNFSGVKSTMRSIGESCKGCHTDYRPMVAALYRGPNFTKLKITHEDGTQQSYKAYMLELTRMINRIKIAMEDNRQEAALNAFNDLEKGTRKVASHCGSCHKGDEEKTRYLDDKLENILVDLKLSIEENNLKSSGRNLGAFAVEACALCHGTHRILYDLKQVVTAPE